MTELDNAKALALLRTPFDDKNIGKLPKVNCWNCNQAAQKERGATCANHRRTTCPDCGNYLTTGHIHIEYVGHAEATDRFLDADPTWTWRPMALTAEGLPLFDEWGGLWMYLTIAGVERIGYGDSGGKRGANAIKEAIGDALRNSGMRFGVGLDQWAKSDLHASKDERQAEADNGEPAAESQPASSEQINSILIKLGEVRGIRDRDAARQALSAIVGYPVSAPRELTAEAAETVLIRLRAEAGAKPEPATGAQTTRLSMLIKGDRNERLKVLSDKVGRPLTSSKDLTKVEASRIIDELDTERPTQSSPAGELMKLMNAAKSSNELAVLSERMWKEREAGRLTETEVSRLQDVSLSRDGQLSKAAR